MPSSSFLMVLVSVFHFLVSASAFEEKASMSITYLPSSRALAALHVIRRLDPNTTTAPEADKVPAHSYGTNEGSSLSGWLEPSMSAVSTIISSLLGAIVGALVAVHLENKAKDRCEKHSNELPLAISAAHVVEDAQYIANQILLTRAPSSEVHLDLGSGQSSRNLRGQMFNELPPSSVACSGNLLLSSSGRSVCSYRRYNVA